MVGRAEVVSVEEELVFYDGTAEAAAEVVVGEMSHAFVEVGASVERAVLYVLGGHAVELVGARVDDHVADCTDGSAQLGFIVRSRDVDGLDGLYWWNQNLEKAGTLLVVDAL